MKAKTTNTSLFAGIGDKLFMIVFGLVWTGATIFLDHHVFSIAVRQVNAQRFPTSPGQVLESRIESFGRKQVRCRPRITFTYEIAGTAYRGNCYAYRDEEWSSDFEKVAQIIRRFPVGAVVTVYYNPHNPADSLLNPGLTGGDLFGVIFALPFNVALLALWWVFIPLSLDRSPRQQAGGAKLFDDGFVARVRLPQITPGAVVLLLGCALPILIMLAVGFTAGSDPPLKTMLVAWSLIFFVAILALVCQWLRVLSGRWDLIIDRTAGTMRLPRSQGRKQELVLPLASVVDVTLDTLGYLTAKGGRSFNYAPVICFNASDGDYHEERIVMWLNKKSAQALVDWLREHLKAYSPLMPQSDDAHP
jgi:hypothetical protein